MLLHYSAHVHPSEGRMEPIKRPNKPPIFNQRPLEDDRTQDTNILLKFTKDVSVKTTAYSLLISSI